MSKHTPAPWVTCNTANIFTKLGAPNAEGTNAPSNDGWMIADCDMGSLSLAEVRANTLLIAAAPDLLDALQIARNYVEAVYLNTPNPKKARNYSQCLEIIDAAINKATGE